MAASATYDEIPYDSQAFVESHPDRLAMLAYLHGVDPRPVDAARVLELGCATGGNLIPMAVAAPGSTFVGVDLSEGQIQSAREIVSTLGLTNVRFEARSLTSLDADFGAFDYIVCHGVYSWVPEPVREHILRICTQNLAPSGVAYISYNTYPGWFGLRTVRELMLYHGDTVAEPGPRAAAVREFLDQLNACLLERESPYARLLDREARQLRTKTDSYIHHEFLEEVNEPCYFHEFLARAAAHGLAYLDDARIRLSTAQQPPQVQAFLDRYAGTDPIRRDQYLDFLLNRMFRRSLLVRPEARPGPVDPTRLAKLRVLAVGGILTPDPDLYGAQPVDLGMKEVGARLTTNDPLLKMAIAVLGRAWPKSLEFEELHEQTVAALRMAPYGTPSVPFSSEPGALTELVLHAYSSGLVDLLRVESPFATELSERPTISPYARLQLEGGISRLTNLRHRIVEPSVFDRLVAKQCDGTRTRGEILDMLVAAALDGTFPLTRDGQVLQDVLEIRRILDRSLDPSLHRMAGAALLVG